MTGTTNCVVKGLRLACTLSRHADDALLAATPLRRGITHPSSYEALRLQAIQGRVERPDRASASGYAFYFPPDCGAVSAIAQPRGRAEQEVFEFAEHDYSYIVILMLIHFLCDINSD
jgi:hypothetical protein